ncbi:peptidoglycan-binding protein LysM [Arenimonas soli]|uniref:Peptidoglycan-binding protein LysM n=1 Tax=Arenimonas soli TaxID=2269504 RepID=A0ABQ1HC29_9GAMM|nr:peptidoglycan DD-metalloendopeptidase family protein [Arenimonas soli]GGA70458.1 peptidoglycan-binding protein LysM [Arenimonas soli]
MKTSFARGLVCILAIALVAGCGHSRVVKREGSRPAPDRATQSLPSSGDYKVKRGDTLYGIAFRHGLDYREVASLNRIGPPYTIYPGQTLRLSSQQRAAPARAVTSMPSPRTPPPSGSRGTTPARPATPAATPATPATPVATPARPVAAPALPAVPDAAPASGTWRWPTQGQVIGRFVSGDPKRQGLDIAGSAGQPVVAAADGVIVYSGSGLVGYGELIIVKHSDEWLSAYAHNRRRLVGEGAQVKAGQQIAELGRTGTSRDMLHFEVRRNGKPVDPMQVLPRQ